MNKAKASLEANMEEILANLPKDLHADLKKEVDGMSGQAEPVLSGEAEINAIKAELVANPSVDETDAAGELKDIKAPQAVTPATEAELKEQEANALTAVQK